MKFKISKNRRREIYRAALIVIAGNFLGIGLMAAERKAADREYLERNSYGEGGYEERLEVQSGNKKQEIAIFVEEQKYTSEEVEEYLEQAERELTVWLKEQTGKGGTLRHSLEFPEQLTGNPSRLSWSTDKPELLNWKGTLGETIENTGEKVNIICSISLEDEEKIWKKEVTVYPADLSSEERFQREIQEQAENNNDAFSSKFYLPQTLHGEKLRYKRTGSSNGMLLCIGSVILGVGVFPLRKEKEKEREIRRRKEMQMDYPDIVEKLVLFLRAGFSIRKAMEKLSEGYLRNKEKYHGKERPGYEEVVKTCRELSGGVYEAEAYERMGKRCGISQYKMLSVLLVQNLQKGNQSILELLEREAAAAGEERKRNAKTKGEEASTKLLFPMVMQLLVVIVILVVPAFWSFM